MQNFSIKKVDTLKTFGIVQGFLSVNPNVPKGYIFATPKKGFITVGSYKELKNLILRSIDEKKEFFSGSMSYEELGEIIREASKERTLEEKARKFLKLLRGRMDA